MIYRFLQGQASVSSYIDIVPYIAILCGCMVPRVFLMKDPRKEQRPRLVELRPHRKKRRTPK